MGASEQACPYASTTNSHATSTTAGHACSTTASGCLEYAATAQRKFCSIRWSACSCASCYLHTCTNRTSASSGPVCKLPASPTPTTTIILCSGATPTSTSGGDVYATTSGRQIGEDNLRRRHVFSASSWTLN